MSDRRRAGRLRAALALAACLASPAARPGEAAPDPAAAGGPELTLAALLESAMRTNPLAEAAALDAEAAEAERRAMAGRRWPTLSSLLLAGPTPEARGDPVTSTTPVDDYGELVRNLGPFFRAEISLTQPLYSFGKLGHAERALAGAAGARRAQAAQARWELAGQVKSAYYGLLLVEDLLALAAEVRGWLDEARVRLDRRIERDDAEVAPSDRARLAVREAELEARRIDLARRRVVLRDALVRLTGVDVPAGWRLAERTLSAVDLGPFAPEALLDEALRARPEVRAAEAGVEALRAKRDALRARWWPDLFLAGRLRYAVAPNRDDQTSPFANDDFNLLDAGVALGLRYEWPTGVRGPETARAGAELRALEARREALAGKVSHELTAAVEEWRAAAARIEAARGGVRSARSWAAFAREGFELGTVPARELVDALSAYVDARVALSTATHEHNVAVAHLSHAAGRELLPGLGAESW